MLRRLLQLLLLGGVVALFLPFFVASLYVDQRGVTLPGKVWSKSETVTVHNSAWTRQCEITIEYSPPDSGITGFQNVHLPPERYDEFHKGQSVSLHYLLKKDIPDLPLAKFSARVSRIADGAAGWREHVFRGWRRSSRRPSPHYSDLRRNYRTADFLAAIRHARLRVGGCVRRVAMRGVRVGDRFSQAVTETRGRRATGHRASEEHRSNYAIVRGKLAPAAWMRTSSASAGVEFVPPAHQRRWSRGLDRRRFGAWAEGGHRGRY